MENNKGITLISLVASIILMIILAATTVVTSMNAYKQMRFEGAKAELEEVQKIINEIASDYQTYLKEQGVTKTYVNYFQDRYDANFSSKLLSNYSSDSDVQVLKNKYTEIDTALNPSNPSSTAFYFTEDDLVKYFGLKGIENVVVDFSTRAVYSVEGIEDSKDETKIYYTSTDWGDKSKISNNNVDNFTIEVKIEKLTAASTRDVKLTFQKNTNGVKQDFKLANRISEVYLKIDDKYVKIENFRDISTNSVTIIAVAIEKAGTYEIRLVDELKNCYDTGNITLD